MAAHSSPAAADPQEAAGPNLRITPRKRKSDTPSSTFAKAVALCRSNRTFKRLLTSGEDDPKLVKIVVVGGWPDHEIVALLAASHRKGVGLHRASNPKRVPALIRRARADIERDDAIEDCIMTNPAGPIRPENVTAEYRADALEKVSLALGVPIKRFVKYGRRGELYLIKIGSYEELIPIGDLNAVKDYKKFCTPIESVTDRFIPLVKPIKFRQIIQRLLSVAKTVDDPELVPTNVTAGWIASYLEFNVFDELPVALEKRGPFLRDGCLWLFLRMLHRFVNEMLEVGISRRRLLVDLIQIGFQPGCIHQTTPQGRTSLHCYRASLDDARIRSVVPDEILDRCPHNEVLALDSYAREILLGGNAKQKALSTLSNARVLV